MHKKRAFRKYTYRGVDLDHLLDMSNDQLGDLMHSRVRRRFARGMQRKSVVLVKKLRKAKKEAPPLEKPEIVKTHMRSMIVVPEMIGSIVGVYNGKTFNQVSWLINWDILGFPRSPHDETMTRLTWILLGNWEQRFVAPSDHLGILRQMF